MNLCCFDVFFKRKRAKGTSQKADEIGNVLPSIGDVNVYSSNELKIATKNFHTDNKIGTGGFGSVYKGVLKDGTQVAVKTLSAQSKQGDQEFLTEIATISDVRHENLVKLYGCCVEGSHRMLVYEYLENNSIAQALLGPENTRLDLDWPRRSKICMGTACGLAYLHEGPHIVHRDIKASNVLLDRDLNPKISDFGLAKLFPDNVTHISTRVAGTIGYLAPEYAIRGQLTKKADIYSFGILVLEIISGRSNSMSTVPNEQQFLLEWVKTWQLREEGKLLDMVDPMLKEYPEEEVARFIKVALLCTQAAANFRPSMSQVVAMLSKEININEKLLSRPGFISDFKNLKTQGKTHKFPSRTNPHGHQMSHLTALQKGAASSSSSSSMTVTTTSIFSSSPVSFTQMEPSCLYINEDGQV